MKIAIVGSGISGMTAAKNLYTNHEVTLFEAQDYVGGHTHTHKIKSNDGLLNIDTGFIVFNKKTYKNFFRMLEAAGVAYQETKMSFSVKCEKTGLEYNGTSLNSLFAQRKNFFKPSFYKFLLGIGHFNKAAKKFLAHSNAQISLRSFIETENIPKDVVDFYFIPMASAVWSADLDLMWDFPAKFILQFWENHGFLEINDRPQWYVIKGGSSAYIASFTKPFSDRIRLNTPVKSVWRDAGVVTVATKDGSEVFDKIIFACHSNQVLKILRDIDEAENSLLSSVPYQKNRAILHTDASLLPKKKLAWAAWNYHLNDSQTSKKSAASVTYNMNILQELESETIYNVTLNPITEIDKKTVIKELEYEHPIFTLESVKQQDGYAEWMGRNNTYFAGAYLRYGFHEDGVITAMRVANHVQGRAIDDGIF